MGIIANVYRSGRTTAEGAFIANDCTLDGWSGLRGFDSVCVVNVEGPFEPDEKHPAVLIRRHRTMPALHIVSKHHLDAGHWTMFGGNFLHSSDSRFSKACNDIMAYGNDWPLRPDAKYPVNSDMSFHAIPIHDRIE